MQKIGVFTRHYEIFYELTNELKHLCDSGEMEREDHHATGNRKIILDYFAPPMPIPKEVRIVITTERERELLISEERRDFREKVFETEVGTRTVLTLPSDYEREDMRICLKRIFSLLRGKKEYSSILIGIDPGEKPGVAVYGDRVLIYTCALQLPDDCAGIIEKVLNMFPARGRLIRIGHGDRVIRNRIINSLLRFGIPLEIVDESRTSVQSKNPHIDAAKRIALSGRGASVTKNLDVEPSPGYLEYIKKRSRRLSLGRFSIDKNLAKKVAIGALSLEEAVKKREKEKDGN